MLDPTHVYFVVHGVATVGATVAFLIRNEHRMTVLETKLNRLQQEHDNLTSFKANSRFHDRSAA